MDSYFNNLRQIYCDQNGGVINNENIFYILFLLLFILILFIFYKLKNNHYLLIDKINQEQQIRMQQKIDQDLQTIKNQKNIENEKQKKTTIHIKQSDNVPNVNPWREYDYRTLNDPLVAPRRRDDYNLPVLPLPTRGFPPPFKKMGLLIDKTENNHNKYKILILMGRNKHHNSNIYDYYATENSKDSILKFNIEKTRELQTGDKILIHEIDKKYEVVLDKMLENEYDPYIY
jgi:hypothetical protein